MSSKTRSKNKPVELRKDGIPALDIYKDVPIDNASQNHCLVQDKHGQTFVFKTKSHCTIVATGIDRIYDNFNDFSDREIALDVIDSHNKLFNVQGIHKTLEDKDSGYILLKLLVWKTLCARANQRLEKPVKIDETTKQPVGRKLANRSYILVKDDWTGVTIPQAIACLRIVKDNVIEEGGVRSVKEDLLKVEITKRAGELKTRQEPWRIFQYYRPSLIAAGLLRLV